jgi:hypothetical protein
MDQWPTKGFSLLTMLSGLVLLFGISTTGRASEIVIGGLDRAVELDSIADRTIDLPGTASPGQAPVYSVGTNLYIELTNSILNTPSDTTKASSSLPPDPVGLDDPNPIVTPSASVGISILEAAFTAGSKGNRTFYGFKENGQNVWNAGTDPSKRNEFLYEKLGDSGFFGPEFTDYTGFLRTGLDLSESIDLEVLLGGIKVATESYKASLTVQLDVTNSLGAAFAKKIIVLGSGFFADVDAHLSIQSGTYRLAFSILRANAIEKAFSKLIKTLTGAIGTEVATLPLYTTVVEAVPDGASSYYYLRGGGNFSISIGERFYDRTAFESGKAPAVLTVTQVYPHYAMAHLDSGMFQSADVLVSLAAGQNPPTLGAQTASALEVEKSSSVAAGGGTTVDDRAA